MAKRVKKKRPIDKQSTPSAAFAEIGVSGLDHSAGEIRDDFVRELQSPVKRVKLYREIRDNSPIIGGAYLAIENLLRGISIKVRPGGNSNADLEAARFIQTSISDMAHSWDVGLSRALTMLTYGYSVLEVVLKKRQGDQHGKSVPSSLYNDGRIGWHKLAPRAQESIDSWQFDSRGDVTGLIQRPAPDFRIRKIPIEKVFHFRTTDDRDSPEGRAPLRNSVFSWKFIKRIQEIEGVGVERDLAGLPIAWVPPEVLAGATAQHAATKAEVQKLIRNIRRDEQEGVIMPLMLDQHGNKKYDLTLLSTGGSRQFETTKIIQRYEQRMLLSLLADFLLLGHERVGSFSLSSDKTDLFSIAIITFLESILDVWNKHAIPQLIRLNGMNVTFPPMLAHGDIEKTDLIELGQYLMNISNAGIILPDQDGSLSNHLLALADLPNNVEQDMTVGKGGAWDTRTVQRKLMVELGEMRKEIQEYVKKERRRWV